LAFLPDYANFSFITYNTERDDFAEVLRKFLQKVSSLYKYGGFSKMPNVGKRKMPQSATLHKYFGDVIAQNIALTF